MPGPSPRQLPDSCMCGCGAPIETCNRRRSKASILERRDEEGILELQCKKCSLWLVLECFPPIGKKCNTRHGILTWCRNCRQKDQRRWPCRDIRRSVHPPTKPSP